MIAVLMCPSREPLKKLSLTEKSPLSNMYSRGGATAVRAKPVAIIPIDMKAINDASCFFLSELIKISIFIHLLSTLTPW